VEAVRTVCTVPYERRDHRPDEGRVLSCFLLLERNNGSISFRRSTSAAF